ncbi:MAG: hypothetical protein K2I96_17705 [Lachnospiraceae bacterium]|nr:hypothetical protein [Lachnospiraceae bacterium]
MTDSEKLDLLISEMQGMKSEIQGMKSDMQGMKSEMQGMKSDMQGMKEKIDKLALGQLEIEKEIYILNRRLTDTYNVALDALGTSAENRKWIEHGTLI